MHRDDQCDCLAMKDGRVDSSTCDMHRDGLQQWPQAHQAEAAKSEKALTDMEKMLAIAHEAVDKVEINFDRPEVIKVLNDLQDVTDVNHPKHYNFGKIEVIEMIEDQELGYHLGCALKYICRAGRKPGQEASKDLEKARWYIRRFIEIQKEKPCRPNEMNG